MAAQNAPPSTIGTGNPQILLQLLNKCLVDEEDIDIDVYCAVWKELCGFLSKWGVVFKFVVDDVNTKVQGIESIRAETPDRTKTLLSLTSWENEMGTLRNYDPKSGTVNVLILHRAMYFVVALIDGVYEAADDNAKVSTIGRAAYDRTLAKHHSWLVRKVVSGAMIALPYRKDFMASMRGNMSPSEDERFYKSFDAATTKIQDRVSAVLEHYEMTHFSKHS